jgi:hypothetical protein
VLIDNICVNMSTTIATLAEAKDTELAELALQKVIDDHDKQLDQEAIEAAAAAATPDTDTGVYIDAYSDLYSEQQYTPDSNAAPTCTVRRAASLLARRDAVHSNSNSNSHVAWSDNFDGDEKDITDDDIDNSSDAADLSRIDKLVWEFEVSNITILYYTLVYYTTELKCATVYLFSTYVL